ncbi:Trm112 family protein [Paracnuella aquatica]|uniref:Trm112 family protein n=1 Tax=Paracnuella aquatica TaxID=2268757 RepID=UPI000DEFB220|nr:Trm112 family protein [Paracnuella aquatica]RPD49026.1 hypothetical protein DRJ53_07855 [Paracnuella aquatica]
MKASLINKLCCPFDKHDLAVQVFVKDQQEHIIEGMLTCTHCKRYYPIAYGVPIMSPDEYREPQLETPLLQRWSQHLPAQHFEGFRLLQDAKE